MAFKDIIVKALALDGIVAKQNAQKVAIDEIMADRITQIEAQIIRAGTNDVEGLDGKPIDKQAVIAENQAEITRWQTMKARL